MSKVKRKIYAIIFYLKKSLSGKANYKHDVYRKSTSAVSHNIAHMLLIIIIYTIISGSLSTL